MRQGVLCNSVSLLAYILELIPNQAWYFTPVIPPLGRQRHEDCHRLKASLSCIVQPYLEKKEKKQSKGIKEGSDSRSRGRCLKAKWVTNLPLTVTSLPSPLSLEPLQSSRRGEGGKGDKTRNPIPYMSSSHVQVLTT